MPSWEDQLAEVELILASTSQSEFHWRGSGEDIAAWEAALDQSGSEAHAPPLSYALRLTPEESTNVLWLNVDHDREQLQEVHFVLQGPLVSRDDLKRVQHIIDERRRIAVKEDYGNVVFDVYTATQEYLTENPLKDSATVHSPQLTKGVEQVKLERAVKMSRVIFWSHHLKAPSKKRDMTSWCSELRLWGLVKSGYPAYLCFEGQQDDVQTIVKRIKALQWHAITVKTEEPYTYEASESCSSMDEIQEEALMHCLLAKRHSALDTSGQAVKLRTTMDEVQSGKELVARLKQAGVPTDEYMFALNLRGE